MTSYKFNTIEEAIEDIRKGKMVVVVDDEDEIADAISDQTGWCVLSFEPELLP